MSDRQSRPKKISHHHIERYIHAHQLARQPILDAACGMGYGTAMLSAKGETVGVDIEPAATSLALQHYDNGSVEWITGDILDRPWGSRKFRTIVSFETLEHMKEPEKALEHFRDSLTDDGLLVASVPNQEIYPFQPQDFAGAKYPHHRHYTPAEFTELLTKSGFTVIQRCMQISKEIPGVLPGSRGMFLVFTSRLASDTWLQTR